MSIFKWLAPKPNPALTTNFPPEEDVKPVSRARSSAEAAADVKHQRKERREQLYIVVRDVMLRSEVLAANYRFKVLSLDPRGRQSLIMIDLMGESGVDPQRLNALETLIVTTAAKWHDLVVKAVYWRLSLTQRPASSPTPPARVAPVPAQAATQSAMPEVMTGSAFDQIDQDELLAFKKAVADSALSGGVRKPASSARAAAQSTRAGADFEATQFLDNDEVASPLSSTQYGDLD